MGIVLLASAAISTGQEPESSNAAIAALERLVQKVVRQEGASVVAIAQDRRRRGVERLGPLFDQNPAGLRRVSGDRPEFVPTFFGSGVVIDTSGLVLTSYHVIGLDNEDYTVDHYVTTADRRIFPAKVRAADPRSDLAVLELVPAAVDGKLQPPKLTPLRFGDGDAVQRGQIVLALGNPYALARDGQATATWGTVTNVQRRIAVPQETEFVEPRGRQALYHYGSLIQTDLRMQLGASGGALLNRNGELIGLTVALSAHLGYETPAGFAVPVNGLFRRVVEALREGREVEYGFLGIAPTSLARDELPPGSAGVRVDRVIRGTPADRAGLRRGDIVSHVDGTAIHDPDGLILNVTQHPPGRRVKLSVRQDGRDSEIAVELVKFAPLPGAIVTRRPPAWRGLRVDQPSAVFDLRQLVEVPQGCVAIAEVEPDTPAWKQGLRRETLVFQVRGQRVTTPNEFRAAVAAERGEVPLLVAALQGGTTTVTIGEQ